MRIDEQVVNVGYDDPLWDEVEEIADDMGPDLKQEPMEDVAQ